MAKRKTGATITQVAQKAGVSVATVSRVFNNTGAVHGDTRQKVLQTAQVLEYRHERPAAPPRNEKRLLVMSLPAISNPFYHEIVRGAKSAAVLHNAELMITEGKLHPGNLDALINMLKKVGCQGLIMLNYITTEMVNKLNDALPLVQCCEFEEDTPVSAVSIDDKAATLKVMNYLISLGKTKIGLINGPIEYKYARHRKSGYQDAMENAGLRVSPHWIIQLPEINPEMAFSSTVKLLSQPDAPDTFFAASDLCAAAVIRAARYYGYNVPDDIVVAGFDNIDISSIIVPSITTVNQPKFQLGYTACELLMSKMENPQSETQRMVLETELIIRESTSIAGAARVVGAGSQML